VSDEIDHRSDVYSLGIIIYEMICGRPPFTSQGFGDVLMMQMAMVPPPPSSLNPEVPPRLERTILRALEKRPEDRFATIADFQAELGAQRTQATPSRSGLSEVGALDATLAPSGPVSARVATAPARSRRPVLLGGAALVGAAVVLVGVLLGTRGPDVATAPSPARVAAPSPAAVAPPPVAEAPRPAPAVDDTAAPARPVEVKAPVRRKPPRPAKAPAPVPRLEKL
jgi:serine/threonine-protein kinase